MSSEDGKVTLGEANPILAQLAKQLAKQEGPAQAAPPKEQPGKNKGKSKSKEKRKQAQPPAHMEREVKRTPEGDFTGVEAEMLKKHEEAEEAARLKALETADTLEAIKAVPPTRRGTYSTDEDDAMTDDYKVSPPEKVGAIPLRIEIPVDKSTKEIGWTCRMYSGGEVYRLDPEEQPTRDTLDAFTVKDRHIPRDQPLEAGQRLLCPTLFGYGIGVVGQDGHVTSANGSTLFMVSRADDGDDRACWVCHGSGNLKAIKKLTLNAD